MKRLASNIIDSKIEGHYAFFPVVEQITTQEHQHDFYEIFIVASGSIYHHINSEKLLLSNGDLVFIRPNDRHFYSKNADQNCKLINVAFLTETFNALSEYLNFDPYETTLTTIPLPPTILLTTSEKNALVDQMKEWGYLTYRDQSHARLVLRVLLAHIISKFFMTQFDRQRNDIPFWLNELCQHMQNKPEYVIEGRGALMRLANRTPEYVGRSFKEHLGITPSQFINNLRLDYASNLLLHTDQPVIEICYDVGFGNLSHFYHLFRKRWGCSPIQFRKTNRRTLVP